MSGDRPVRARRTSTAAKKTPAKKTSTARSAPAKRAVTAKATKPAKAREVSVGTDAAFAAGTPQPRRKLKNISEVRHFFRTNDVPILFFGATPFNLLGLDRWVRN